MCELYLSTSRLGWLRSYIIREGYEPSTKGVFMVLEFRPSSSRRIIYCMYTEFIRIVTRMDNMILCQAAKRERGQHRKVYAHAFGAQGRIQLP